MQKPQRIILKLNSIMGLALDGIANDSSGKLWEGEAVILVSDK